MPRLRSPARTSSRFRIAAAVRALGAPACPPQAPQSNEAWYGLFSVVLPWAHSTTSLPKSRVRPIVVSATCANSTCSLCGMASRSITVGAAGATASRSRRRTAPVAAGIRVLAAESGAAAQPAASARVKGATNDSLAAWNADSAPARPEVPATCRATASWARSAGFSAMSWFGEISTGHRSLGAPPRTSV